METICSLCVGAAAVLDTVLLLALLEPRNWRRSRVPIFTCVLGFWLWHVGLFSRLLLAQMTGPWAAQVRWSFAVVAGAGLLLIPCALHHLALRLRRFGTPAGTGFNVRHTAAYLPLLLVAPLAGGIWPEAGEASLRLPPIWITLYLVWLGGTGGACALAFRRMQDRAPDAPTARFARWMTLALAATCAAALAIHLVAAPLAPGLHRELEVALALLPILPEALFAVFVIRYNILELVLERALVYGALIGGALLFHRLTVSDWTTAMEERYRVDISLIEGVVVSGLILAYNPIRQRLFEALRYLLGSRVARERDEIRRLSIEMSGFASHRPEELLAWFTASAQRAFDARAGGAWLLSDSSPEPRAAGGSLDLPAESVRDIWRHLGDARVTTRFNAPEAAAPLLRAAGVSLAFKLPEPEAALVLLGPRRRNRELADEEINAASLLAEQLAAALRANRLQAERLHAERRALQGEKLAALGLLASSIAHEVKNPLSSMKSIATVLAEDLGPESPHEKDVRLILGEIDRLATRTSQLLEFARPPRMSGAPAALGTVVEQTLSLMRHLARQQNVALELTPGPPVPAVAADEASLREIVFNLLTNAIEAAGRQPGAPRVRVKLGGAGGHATLEVEDNGPGIPVELQEKIFEPFFTTRESGTGLGLHVVSRRVRELGGEVHLTSSPGAGTSFLVKLPIREKA
ncbi:MAG TPA: ATP-binding protein [Planctomycetota bacterium]|nr:ATP-binding protein [Planctomycetota bacterium]